MKRLELSDVRSMHFIFKNINYSNKPIYFYHRNIEGSHADPRIGVR
jgi:hypothetical protein